MAPFKQNEDWICPDASCGNNNFARRVECNKCGIAKPFNKANFKQQGHEIGENMAEMSKGLFSAEDWQCSQCGNVNWARRNTCNMCMTPKHKTVENRTGFGGGFMERERNVEYKFNKEDDSNEYDEFGRKKRKFRKESGEQNGSDADTSSPPESCSKGSAGDSEQPHDKRIKVVDCSTRKGSTESETDSRLEDKLNNSDKEEEDSDSEADLSKYAFTDDEEEEQDQVIAKTPLKKAVSLDNTGDR